MHKKIMFIDFYYYLSYSYIPQWILFIVEHVLFLLNPLDPFETPNHTLKSLKKFGKNMRKCFIAHQRLSEIFHGPSISA